MHPIYIEVSDEITTVIERLKETEENQVALVVPQGASILQSIVNLKLAKKAAVDAGKTLSLVTTDKIGKNLAAQVGLDVHDTLQQAEAGAVSEPEPDVQVINGVRIHRYYNEATAPAEAPANANAEETVAPIVPREILKENEEPVANPIQVRAIAPVPVETKKAAGKAETAVAAATETAAPEAAASGIETVADQPAEAPIAPAAPAVAITPPIAAPAQKQPSTRTGKSRGKKIALLIAYLLILTSLAAVGAGLWFLPQTTISVAVPSEPWEKNLSIVAQPASSTFKLEEAVIETAEELRWNASGKKDVGKYASGVATIYNGSSTSSQRIPAGTVITSNGRNFATSTEVSVPGYRQEPGKTPEFGSIEVVIQAQERGTASNLTNASGTISQGVGLGVQKITTKDGTDEQISVVTATDIANARAALTKQARDNAGLKLVESLQGRKVLFDADADTFAFDDFSTPVSAGSEGDTFIVQGRGVLKRFFIDEETISQVVTAQLKQEQQSDHTYTQTELEVTSVKTDVVAATLTLETVNRGFVAPTVNLDGLKKELTGQNQANATSLIRSRAQNADVTIEKNPQWWPLNNLPYTDKYLEIKVVVKNNG